jgi:Neuraminidase (sialidase)
MAIVGGFANPSKKKTLLTPIITSSKDGGATWSEPLDFSTDLTPSEAVIPYGRIVLGTDGSLRTAVVHLPDYPIMTKSAVYMVVSRDGGKTWTEVSKVADEITETTIAEIAPKEWLALARTRPAAAPTQGEIRQYRTKDDGATWQDEGLVTKPLAIPPNLIRLKDGRLLLTYSERSFGGIQAQLSDDGGLSWKRPIAISSYKGEGGYPTSIETADGSIVTAYYSKKSPALGEGQEKLHAAVVKWHLP